VKGFRFGFVLAIKVKQPGGFARENFRQGIGQDFLRFGIFGQNCFNLGEQVL